MIGLRRILIVIGAAATLAACSSYPDAPRYPIYANPDGTRAAPPPAPYGQPPYGQEAQPYQAPDAAPPTAAPYEPIESSPLPPTGGVQPDRLPDFPAPTVRPPAGTDPVLPTPAPDGPVRPGAAYTIVQGDTISGVGRRFQTPVQTLIDLNGLGPRGAITVGQRLILPDNAVDTGLDPYATGASPVGVIVPANGAPPPPPPPPPSGNPPAPAANPSSDGRGLFVWPVRGDIVRRFGPMGVGERNNGVNIGAAAGETVRAAAAGRVAYVGDDQPGQGLTIIVIHRDGWRTVYGHLGSANVSFGDEVRQGQEIGSVGLTAGDGRPSMHFETRHMRGDDPVAIDPTTLLPR